MRLALISDIHGNLAALEAVIADIAQWQIERVVCLGDAVASGPQPRQVIELLARHADGLVLGNTDAFILDPRMTADADEDTQRWEIIDTWCAVQLGRDDINFMQTFSPTLEITLDDGIQVLAFHGSPRSFHDRILATTPDVELDAMFGSPTATVLVGGHTHIQMLRRYNNHILLNPGSVGMAYTTTANGSIINPAWAEYAIVECVGGSLSVDLRRVPFDRAVVAQAILASGIPYAEWLAKGWVTDH